MSHEWYEKSHITVGPWGGHGGARWEDGVYCTIRKIIISHGAGIDSIQIEYDSRGCSVWSEKHGGFGGNRTDKIKLDYPNEYLCSITGHYGSIDEFGPVIVRSLMFESNKKRYGPFGTPLGTIFSFPVTGGKVVGLHGRSSFHLDSIGVYLKPLVQRDPPKNLASSFNYGSNANGTSENNTSYDIMVDVKEKTDSMLVSNRRTSEFTRKEKVYNTTEASKRSSNTTHFSGEKEDCCYVPNQSFSQYETSNRVYPTLGAARRFPNIMQASREEEDVLYVPSQIYDEIKFNMMFGSGEAAKGNPSKRQAEDRVFITNQVHSELDTIDKVYGSNQTGKGSANMRQVVSLGPWGGSGGMIFNDGVFTGVREIHLARSGAVVSLRACYDLNGEAVWGNKNGGNGGVRLDKISFDFPHECLIRISGYYGSMNIRGPIVVKSLTFYSNKTKYGPFGDEQGIPFSSGSGSGSGSGVIVGFHGRKSLFLDSIGVHVIQRKAPSPFTSYDAFNKVFT